MEPELMIYLIKIFSPIINKIILNINRVKYSSYKINGLIMIRNKGSIKIGENFYANCGKYFNPIGGDTVMRLIVSENSRIEIGNNVGISNSTLVAQNEIKIHDNVMIGGGCKIWDTDFHSIGIDRQLKKDKKTKKLPIEIRKNAWIGGSSIILKGVTIGENSIIAAGSVVTKSIPDNEIWGGNPAKLIREINNENTP